MSFEEDSHRLHDFGLTPNQAKSYLATIQLGVATISQIAKTAKIRREAVYRVLPKLENLGLLERILGNPLKVKATPIENALGILIQREHDRTQQHISMLQTQKENFIDNFSMVTIAPPVGEPHFSLIADREAIISKGVQMLSQAKTALDIMISRDSFHHYFGNYQDFLMKAISNGAVIRLLLNITEPNDSILQMIERYNDKGAPFAVKYTQKPVNRYMIKDYSEALFATSMEPATGRNPSLWTNDANFIEILQRNFEKIWHTSTRIDVVPTVSREERMKQLLHELQPTNHALFLYKTRDIKHMILFSFLAMGLERGEAAIYIATEESREHIRDAMMKWGLDVEVNEKTGALQIFEYESSIYDLKAQYDASLIISNIKQLYYDAIEQGFQGCRITGEMTCFFQRDMVEEMIDYEHALHRILDLPIIGICAFNSQSLNRLNDPLRIYNELLKAHGILLFMGANDDFGKIDIQHSS
jgi:sugar-specific transcriptional regulator TrmB